MNRIIKYIQDAIFQYVKQKRVNKYLWILDSGHGALQKGKRSNHLKGGQQLIEYQFNFRVATRLSELLSFHGIAFVLTNPEPELIGSALDYRIDFANNFDTKLKKIFVSIHGNAENTTTWGSANGIETWHYKGSKQGIEIAKIFQSEIIKSSGRKDRGLKYRSKYQFAVLRKTKMPAILTENGFFTNIEECKLMLTDAYVEKIALGHLNAILHIENKK